MATDAPAGVQRMFADLFAGFHRDNLARERKAAEADPHRLRLSRVFDGPHGLSYQYVYGGTNRKRQLIYFCWSVHRNVAGYFLGWRQIRQRNGVVKRDMWAARRQRKAVRVLAQRRAERSRNAGQVDPQRGEVKAPRP